jgi:adenylate kinase
MSFNVIFVAGVHGVGKGFLSEKLSDLHNISTDSASRIIRVEEQLEIDNAKIVLDAEKNQDHLNIGLDKLSIETDLLLLDGHFCLKASSGIFTVPIETFEKMRLKAIFLLLDDVEKIYMRMIDRDGESLSKTIIENLQTEEEIQAKKVASTLNVPLIVGKSSKIDIFSNFINDIRLTP